MTEVILVIYFNSNPALMPLQKRPFQLAQCRKIRDFKVDFCLEIFCGHSPRPPFYGVLPQTAPPRGYLDCQVLRAPRYLNPALFYLVFAWVWPHFWKNIASASLGLLDCTEAWYRCCLQCEVCVELELMSVCLCALSRLDDQFYCPQTAKLSTSPSFYLFVFRL